MTIEEFNKFLKKLIEKEQLLLNQKGKEYSGVKDRFTNFKDLGCELALPQEKVAFIYLKKHLDSLKSYINNIGNQEYIDNLSEPILGRINDARNYLALIGGMIEEREKNKLASKAKVSVTTVAT